MKIAIVGPSPIPFTIGGVENLLWGLCDTINQKTIHQAEIIKIPLKENDFWGLIDSYYAYYNLDLAHFDLVISTKYPSWMVQHKNLICYMIHTLRGLYDTYHFMNMPTKVKSNNEEIKQILNYIDRNPNPSSLDDFFDMLFRLKDISYELPKEYFDFPGPFIRRIIRYMDNYGLSRHRNFFAISNTVKNRTDYFPSNTEVHVVYPPSKLKNYLTGDYKHIFFVSRLDAPKRIDMLIKAMKYVKSDVKLYIAGTGPQEEQLKRLAQGDKRINFLGFINDDEVERYYADSLVIPYFPYDEDYGLITIEAMMHKKPVITTVDAGGPTEFVVDRETGFNTKFDPKAIAEKIDYLAQNPDEARRMGENAYNKVKNITWENTINQILKNHEIVVPKVNMFIKNQDRKKITVTTTFPIYPPQGGGQSRVYNLYKNFAKKFDVEIISFTNVDQKNYNGFIAANLKELRIPKSIEHQQKEWDMEKKIGIPISDIGMITLSSYTPAFSDALKNSMQSSDYVVLCHPYLYNEVRKYIGDKKIIYEAQDVEFILKKRMLPNTHLTKVLLQQVFDIEKECCENSTLIMTCSYEDKVTLHNLYGISMDKIIVVPNGVDCDETYYTSVEQRLESKKRLGLEEEKLALFMGSWHNPNLEACEDIFKIAPNCPDVKFLIMGSQCSYFNNKKDIPSNVGFLGLVSEDIKNRFFSVVDIALNPMTSGSGTNLKMFDYMSAGIPVITTEFGSRGIDNKKIFLISEIDQMAKTINEFELQDHMVMIENARKYVEQTFDWKVIAGELLKNLEAL